jgi:hypothetical protein
MSSQICMSDIKRNIQQKLFWFCKLGCIFFSLEYQFVVNSKQSRSLWKKILSLHNVVKYVKRNIPQKLGFLICKLVL